MMVMTMSSLSLSSLCKLLLLSLFFFIANVAAASSTQHQHGEDDNMMTMGSSTNSGVSKIVADALKEQYFGANVDSKVDKKGKKEGGGWTRLADGMEIAAEERGGGEVGGEGRGGCGKAPPVSPGESAALTLMVDGIERGYILHVPLVYNRSTATPLVFDFHGFFDDANHEEKEDRFSTLGDSENFITVVRFSMIERKE